jgi:hypothetical protein
MATKSIQAEELVRIADAPSDRQYWMQRSFVDDCLRARLGDVNVLLVPQEGFRDYDGPLFPVGTEEFFRFLRENAPADAKVDICISDDDYKELALHADWLILAGVVVTSVIAPVVVNLVSEYLKNRLWPNEATRGVKVQLVCQQSEQAQCAIGVSYEGPADKFQPTMLAAIESLSNRKAETSPKVIDVKAPPSSPANTKSSS